jgi:hypothetical protein
MWALPDVPAGGPTAAAPASAGIRRAAARAFPAADQAGPVGAPAVPGELAATAEDEARQAEPASTAVCCRAVRLVVPRCRDGPAARKPAESPGAAAMAAAERSSGPPSDAPAAPVRFSDLRCGAGSSGEPRARWARGSLDAARAEPGVPTPAQTMRRPPAFREPREPAPEREAAPPPRLEALPQALVRVRVFPWLGPPPQVAPPAVPPWEPRVLAGEASQVPRVAVFRRLSAQGPPRRAQALPLLELAALAVPQGA